MISEIRFNAETSGQVYKVYKITIFEGVRKSVKSVSKARLSPRRDPRIERTRVLVGNFEMNPKEVITSCFVGVALNFFPAVKDTRDISVLFIWSPSPSQSGGRSSLLYCHAHVQYETLANSPTSAISIFWGCGVFS